MATKKKLLQAAAGQAGGAGLNVEDVFSTYVYDGSSSAQTITNGIDLSGEGGMVWIKERSTSGSDHGVHDTERGVKNPIFTNLTDAENSYYNTNNLGITAFNSNGFTVASGSNFNDSGDTYASWTFRKAPKFFTCLTYTGSGSGIKTVDHDLGSAPAVMFIKKTSASQDWLVFSKDTSQPHNKYLKLNSTVAEQNYDNIWGENNYLPTDTQFKVQHLANESGATYVAYLFAHNDGDGEFGPDGDADIIKCGTYTGNGSTTGPVIDLGFEPQWLLVKVTDRGGNWFIFDTMRGFTATAENQPRLIPNNNTVEEANASAIKINSTGFQPAQTGDEVNGNGNKYIYIAIRRGPMAVPESATDVFGIDTYGGTSPNPPAFDLGHPVDFGFYKNKATTSSWYVGTRLLGGTTLSTNSTAAESADTNHKFDYQTGWYNDSDTASNIYSWMWKRAPSFCDVVAYTGNGTAGHQIKHNLGVAPDMVWLRSRDLTKDWRVWHKDAGDGDDGLYLNNNFDVVNSLWFNIDVTGNTGYIELNQTGTNFNGSGNTYIAYLFASLDNISKCGSYTGNGASQTIDCGFSSGARFVLIKRTDATENWVVFDTERGIVAGNDPFLRLDTTNAEITGFDLIDPYSSGFSVNNNVTVNASGGTYIFYAIA